MGGALSPGFGILDSAARQSETPASRAAASSGTGRREWIFIVFVLIEWVLAVRLFSDNLEAVNCQTVPLASKVSVILPGHDRSREGGLRPGLLISAEAKSAMVETKWAGVASYSGTTNARPSKRLRAQCVRTFSSVLETGR